MKVQGQVAGGGGSRSIIIVLDTELKGQEPESKHFLIDLDAEGV